MQKKFIKVSSASNEDGDGLFNAICVDIMKEKPKDIKSILGIPSTQSATMKDCITLIQENKLECEIIVRYSLPDSETDPENVFD